MSNKPVKMRNEYPAALIKSGIRGKFSRELKEDSNLVLIDPDLHVQFPDSASVNKALRAYLSQQKPARR